MESRYGRVEQGEGEGGVKKKTKSEGGEFRRSQGIVSLFCSDLGCCYYCCRCVCE